MAATITTTTSHRNSFVTLQRAPSGPQPRRASDLQGIQNIVRLEQSAAVISQGGADLGEVIRRMNEEGKARSSRSNSVRNSIHQDDLVAVTRNASRKMSSTGTHSRTGSTKDAEISGGIAEGKQSDETTRTADEGNTTTSPVVEQSADVTSPRQQHATPARRISSSKTHRLSRTAYMIEPLQEGKPLDSPLGPSNMSQSQSQDLQTSPRGSENSFGKTWDRIAFQMDEEATTLALAHPTVQQLAMEAVPERPDSTDTFQDAELAFKDFDGVHYAPQTEGHLAPDEQGNTIRRVSARSSSGSLLSPTALMRPPQQLRPMSFAVPPPDANMVYYPAPVPRMLNLPKRLSQLPAASVQARRRTQLLNDLPENGGRQSMLWPSTTNLSDHSTSQQSGSGPSAHSTDNRRSMLNQRMSMANLPPQLRASAYFDQPAMAQDVEVKSESAVATLDSILDASANAPVNAFTDHPFAGDVRKSVYASGMVANRRSTMMVDSAPTVTRRRSGIGSMFRRNSTNLENELQRPSSRGGGSILGGLDDDASGRRLQKRRSALSLGDGLDVAERRKSTLGALEGEKGDNFDESHMIHDEDLDDGDAIANDFREEELREDIEDTDVVFAQPSTLLAELQVRKAQMKSRTRTAATAFPNGMHSTLLELDAVEEVSKRNRRIRRVELAWEDPAMRGADAAKDDEDDDVPLAVLYASKDANSKGRIRPLGLMQQREMEDNEPLSSRRNRLRGVSPARPRLGQRAATQPVTQPGAFFKDEEQDEGETLEQRTRRLKTKDALDGAIADIAPKNGERPLSTFAEEVLDQFGGLAVDADKTKAAAVAPEDETLGQRRARLQREAAAATSANGTGTAQRPALRSSSSLANLLSAHSTGARSMTLSSSLRALEPAAGTLLHASAQQQTKHRQDLQNTNLRSSSMLGHHHATGRARNASGAAFAGGVSYPQQMGMGMGMGMTPQQQQMLQMQQLQQLQQMQQMQLQQQMGYGMPMGMPGVYGMGGNMNMNMMNMGMGMGMGMNGMHGMMMMPMEQNAASLQPDQRTAIDRWRMGVGSSSS